MSTRERLDRYCRQHPRQDDEGLDRVLIAACGMVALLLLCLFGCGA